MSVNHIFTKPNKFKIGDKVLNQYGVPYVVTKIIYGRSGHVYRCEGQYRVSNYSEDELSFDWGHDTPPKMRAVDSDNCPRCGTPWHISGFGASKWKDCLKCKKKAEDL